MKVAVPDVAYLGKITPPTAQHAIRQGKVVAHKVAGSLGYGKKKIGPRQPVQHSVVRLPGQGRHPRLPRGCDPAVVIRWAEML